MANAKGVSKAMRRASNKHARNTLLLTQKRLREATPVDTHFAETNWILSVGSPFSGLAGSKDNVDFGMAEHSRDRIRKWDMFKGPAFCENNVPYIDKLNAGSSPQAMAGWVERAIDSAIDEAERQRKL